MVKIGVSVMLTTPVFSQIIYPLDLQEKYKRGGEDFQSLARALNSDDLTGAQKAFATFKRDIQNIQQAQNAWQLSQPAHFYHPVAGAQQTNSSNGTYIDVMA